MAAKIERVSMAAGQTADYLVPAAAVEAGRVAEEDGCSVARPFPDSDVETVDCELAFAGIFGHFPSV